MKLSKRGIFSMGIIALILLVFAVPASAESKEPDSNAAILERLEQMSQKMDQMGKELEGLKKENEALKARLKQVSQQQAETRKAMKVVKPEPRPMETAIPNKPFEGGITVDAEYMSLNIHRNAAPYTGFIYGDATTERDYEIDTMDTEISWDGAYRFKLGYAAPSGWDLGARFMYFSTEENSALGNLDEDNDDVWANFIDRVLVDRVGLNGNFEEGIVDYAQERLEFDFNIFDLEIGNKFQTTENTGIRLFGGFRYAGLDRDSLVTYANLEGVNDIDRALITNKLDVDAYGGRIGGALNWDVWSTGLTVGVGAAVSLLYADFNVTRRDDYNDQSQSEWRFKNIDSSYDAFMPIIDADVALRYSYKWFFAEGGYLFSYWHNADARFEVGGYDDVWDMTVPYNYEKADIIYDGWFLKFGAVF